MNSSTTTRHNAATRLPNRSKISVAPQATKRTAHRHLTNRKTEKAAIVPQKTVPLDLEPKQILLNNNTAKSKNSNPTILSAGSISKPSLRKDAVIFAPIEELHLSDEVVELLKSERFNNRLLCEIISHEKFRELLADAEIYVDGIATMHFHDTNSSLAALRAMILEEHPEATADRAIKVLEACQVEEEDFFCHVTHKTWDVILHDIRKVHENDSESAPDTTPADELIREVQKAMQSPGDRVQQFTEMFCKAFQLKYKRLSQEERSLLKKLFKKSPLIKQSGMNFRRRPWK